MFHRHLLKGPHTEKNLMSICSQAEPLQKRVVIRQIALLHRKPEKGISRSVLLNLDTDRSFILTEICLSAVFAAITPVL